MDRYILCKARGGFNDQLNQIFFCIEYAKKTDRILILDTAGSGINRPFSQIFEVRPNVDVDIRCLSGFSPGFLNGLSTYPNLIQGILFDYQLERRRVSDGTNRQIPVAVVGGRVCPLKLTHRLNGHVVKLHEQPDYNEQLVLHHGGGGGFNGCRALEYFVLKPELANLILNKMCSLPRDLVALHIRNTDMKSYYKPFLDILSQHLVDKNVLLCSDDHAAIAHVSKVLRSVNLIRTTELPDLRGKPLHHDKKYSRTDDFFESLLIDVFALASASQLCASIVKSERKSKHFSGFSVLADMLRCQSKLQRQLLSKADARLLENYFTNGMPSLPKSNELMEILSDAMPNYRAFTNNQASINPQYV